MKIKDKINKLNIKKYWYIYISLLVFLLFLLWYCWKYSIYDYIYYNYITELFRQLLNFPEIGYFIFLIYYFIQYLIIDDRSMYIKVSTSIKEIIFFFLFVAIPFYYEFIKIKKVRLLLDNNWIVSVDIITIKIILLLTFVIILFMILRQEEHYHLLNTTTIFLFLISIFGLLLALSFNNLVFMFISLELSSLSIYILCGIKNYSNKSIEAALKYFIYGSAASVIMLWGIVLIYYLLGTVNYTEIIILLESKDIIKNYIIIYNFAIISILTSFIFKLAIFPLWWWLVEVYEGISYILIFYLTIVQKIAIFFIFYKIFFCIFYISDIILNLLLLLLLITNFIAGILALYEKRIKKIIAYSSINHIAFLIIPLIIDPKLGIMYSIYYFITYLLMSISFFFIILILNKKYQMPIYNLSELISLRKSNKILLIFFSISLLSSAGIPPFCVFFGKLYIFQLLIIKGNYFIFLFLIFLSILNGIYYIRFIRFIFFSKDIKDIFLINKKKISFFEYYILTSFIAVNILFVFLQEPIYNYILYIFLWI